MKPLRKVRTWVRDTITGRFVKKGEAQSRPATTVRESEHAGPEVRDRRARRD